MSTDWKREVHIFAFMLLIVPLAGELNFYPFNDNFRVSFGTPTFFFFLLLFRKNVYMLAGILVGFVVVEFRIFLDIFFYGLHLTGAFQARYPTFFYYVTFAIFFDVACLHRLHHRPILIGFLGIFIEIIASIAELTFQYIALDSPTTLTDIHKISVIAIFRSYFTIGFFNLLKLYKTKLREEQIRRQHTHLLMIISNLYEETIHLSKTLKNSENMTIDSYHLYRSLKEYTDTKYTLEDLAQKALELAGNIHEIKKDNQRIYAGLSKIIFEESYAEFMDIQKLMQIIIQSNNKYASLQGKNLHFILDISGNHPPYHVFKILSIMNNLVANAIEVIEKEGTIRIDVTQVEDRVQFKISDDGPGILEKHRDLIFKPGFTTKYAADGRPSTGIGLTYIKEMVENLTGEIHVQSRPEVSGTIFTICLSIDHLRQRG